MFLLLFLNQFQRTNIEFSCKYRSKLSANGSLWIFSGHFCYYSYLFGNETKVRLRLSEIAKITPSGSSSIEIITTKRNEQHKFVGFPSKDRRDAVVEYVTKFKQNINKNKSPTYRKSISMETHSLNDNNIIDNYKRSKSEKMISSTKHSNSIEEDSFYTNTKSNDNSSSSSVILKTVNISPYPSKSTPPIIPVTINNNNHDNNNNDTSTIGNGHCNDLHSHSLTDLHGDINNNDKMKKKKKKKNKESLSPAKFIGIHSKQQQQQKQQQRTRRKSSGGINYNNPPTFRLQSIHSQQSLHLITPNVDSSDDNDNDNNNNDNNNDNDKSNKNKDIMLKKQSSNKDIGGGTMDTLDILNLDKSLSIRSVHSSSCDQHRNRSLSDSDMPHHDDSPQSTKSEDISSNHHKKENKSKGPGWLSIFQFSTLLRVFIFFFCFSELVHNATFSSSYTLSNGDKPCSK